MKEIQQKTNIRNINVRTYPYDKEHRGFAGIISPEDFNTYYPNPHRYHVRTHTEREILKKHNQKLH